MMKTKDLSIYIHIPFCQSKCYYCDFTSFNLEEDKVKLYINQLIREINLYKDEIKDYRIKTLFFGGGTPSIIQANYIERIIEELDFNLDLSYLEEVSIEANPASLDRLKAKAYYQMGINRISLGAQSLNDKILKKIGRRHKSSQVKTSIDTLRDLGFENISLDFIYGLAGEKLKDIEDIINFIKKEDIRHISYYKLTLEETSPMYTWVGQGKMTLPDEEEEEKFFAYIIDQLDSIGLKRYEISNFAYPGYESKHNKAYWQNNDYLGLGISSHSFLGDRRFANTNNFKEYIDKLEDYEKPLDYLDEPDLDIRLKEHIFMNMRLIEGIDLDKFKNRYNVDLIEYFKKPIKKNLDLDLIKIQEGKLSYTDKGIKFANKIELDFYIN